MDFLDSLDLDASTYKKSRRVRSWYLYEQFKSLERNQLDATRKLKSRSYQDRILRQELAERRARRKLYDQSSYTQSESGIESKSTKTSLNVSTDNFFESFHELQDEEVINKSTVYDEVETDSHIGQSVKFCEDDDDKHSDEHSCTGTIDSVVNVKSEETLTEDIKNYLENEKKPKLQNVDMNFDAVKQKLQCLERLAHMRDFDKFSENEDSLYSIEEEEFKHIIMHDKNVDTPDNNVNLMWTKLVSFAYQVMELNHGNCYYDYGSQFLTAVLACDVLRRGINRMCHILQPYVSPLKFTTDSDSDVSQKNAKRKKQRKYFRKKHGYKRHNALNISEKTNAIRRFNSDDFWEYSSPFTVHRFNGKQYLQASEPCRRITKCSVHKRNPTTKFANYHLWPCTTSDDQLGKGLHVNCSSYCHRVVNPMLHLSLYLDNILRDINHPII